MLRCPSAAAPPEKSKENVYINLTKMFSSNLISLHNLIYLNAVPVLTGCNTGGEIGNRKFSRNRNS